MPLDGLLHRSTETIQPASDAEYRELTVRLWGKGVVERRRVSGAEISCRRFVADASDFIISRIDARNGASGLVPRSLNGALVTNDFPLFKIDIKKLDRKFFEWLTRTRDFVDLCKRASEGTTNRVRLSEERFLAIEIPLPPLTEQRRVVARIEELFSQIHEARALRHQAAEEAEALVVRATSSLLDESDWHVETLDQVLAESPRNGLTPQQQVEDGTRAMLRINSVSSAATRFVDTTAVKRVNVADEVAQQFVVQDDDVFIVRYNGDINRVAKPAIYKGTNESKLVYPDKLMRLRPQRTRMTPDFLVFALNSRSVREQIEGLGKTTAGNIGVSGRDAKSFRVPVPPLAEQRRIVAELDALQAEVDALKRLQAETATELDALLPSILDQAFKGEL